MDKTFSFDEVWNACIDTVPDLGWSVSSTDKASGLIVADQAVVSINSSKVSRLNIRLQKAPAGGTVVNVAFVPPPGMTGGWGTVDKYVELLKKRLPGLQVTVVYGIKRAA
jgi:hypothetical protein